MALARLHIWNPGDLLKSADLNGEFNNILNNPTALISPLTGPVTVTNASSASGSANPFLNLTWTGHNTLKVYPQQSTNFGSTSPDIFTFDGGSAGLQMHLVEQPGGQRLWIWDVAGPGPLVHPHTGGYPAFAVQGDITVGDIVTFSPAANGWGVGLRDATNLTLAAITTLFCASKGPGDTDVNSGPGVSLTPLLNAGGVVNDGNVQITAYGIGTGTLANSIILANRSGASAITQRWVMDTNGMLVPFAANTYDIGTATATVRSIYAGTSVFGSLSALFLTGQTIVANTTHFLGTWASGVTEGQPFEVVIPFNCTVRNLFVRPSAAPGAANVVFTVRKNATTDTAVTCTVGAAGTSASDTTHSVTFAAGDRLTVKVASGVGNGTIGCTASMELVRNP